MLFSCHCEEGALPDEAIFLIDEGIASLQRTQLATTYDLYFSTDHQHLILNLEYPEKDSNHR